MSRILDLAELERLADHVKYEAETLLAHARAELLELAAPVEQGGAAHAPARRYVAERRIAGIARQFTRAQAVLVHGDDRRAAAARAVIGYCDEADARATAAPAVALGAVSA